MSSAVKIEMSDGSSVHVGDKRKLTATVLDVLDIAAAPTQLKMKFLPPSGSANQTVYAKTPSGAEVAFTSSTANTFSAEHEFDEAGWWDIVTTGSGNMAEVDYRRLLVTAVP